MNPKTIAIFVLVAFAGVVFFFLVKPKLSEVGDFGDKLARQRENLKIVNEKLEATRASIAQFKTMDKGDRELIDSALPDDADLPNLFVLIDSLAFSGGLITKDIEIEVGDINDAKITVIAAGSYGSLKAFILGAQKSLRIFDIESISISPEEIKEGGSGSCKFEIIMKTYFE
jgi:Tfp pilus assembly protein PilO